MLYIFVIIIFIFVIIIFFIFPSVFLSKSVLKQFFVVSIAEVLVLRCLLDLVFKMIGQVYGSEEEDDHGDHAVTQLIDFDIIY